MSKSPFDYVKSVTETKEDLSTDVLSFDASYNSFVVNKALSFNVDCVFVANEVNKVSQYIQPKHQYLLYLHSLDKRKRYGKWVKKDPKIEDIELIKMAFDYNDEKAISALNIMTDKQLLQLKELMNKGGKT